MTTVDVRTSRAVGTPLAVGVTLSVTQNPFLQLLLTGWWSWRATAKSALVAINPVRGDTRNRQRSRSDRDKAAATRDPTPLLRRLQEGDGWVKGHVQGVEKTADKAIRGQGPTHLVCPPAKQHRKLLLREPHN